MVAAGLLVHGGGGGVPGTAGVHSDRVPGLADGGRSAPATATVALRASQKFAYAGRLVNPS